MDTSSEAQKHDHAPPVWHAWAVQEVCAFWGVDPQYGLTQARLAGLQQRYGPNALPEDRAPPAWRRFARQFKSPLIVVLGVAACLSVALGHDRDAGVIVVVLICNALIGQYQEGRAERSMTGLRRLHTTQVRVIRAGQPQAVAAHDLVPGDILLLAAGDAIAADARVIEQASLQCAEAVLTGESVPVDKTEAAQALASTLAERRCMLYSGTFVTRGRATAVVVATGVHTEVGRIAELTQHAKEPATPLEARMARLGRSVIIAALGVCGGVIGLGVWRDVPLDQVLMVAISQMVSMVPEGLPIAMTIALAVGMQRMARHGAIVRRLSAVETLGCSTTICTDKTGTLTRNEMTAVALWLPDGRSVDVTGLGYEPRGALTVQGRGIDAAHDHLLAELVEAGVLCNDATLLPPQASDSWRVLGDTTEGALLVLAHKAGLDPDAVRHNTPRLREWPFDASTKWMATAHERPGRILIKGAPEIVLAYCQDAKGVPGERAHQAAEVMAAQALRVLAFACIDVEPDAQGIEPGAGAPAARLLGLIAQRDPPRAGISDVVARCWAAGIRPIMLTGDHPLTARAIAQELGIARASDRVVDGSELERMGEAELRDELDPIAVFSRVTPAQKLRIVEALQARGAVVAMTGDGVNDAPALARADVGVAMGLTGTDVAKSAAKVVLSDDNFASILAAVEQGRVVFGNLQKLIVYLMSTSLAEVLLLLAALIAGLPWPLVAVHILWINIVTEGTVTVNLVMEPADGDEMQRAPRARDSSFFAGGLWHRIIWLSGLMALLTGAWFVWRLQHNLPLAQVRTETFTLLVMCQWFNVLNCRFSHASGLTWRGQGHGWLLGGLALSAGLQAAVLYLPLLQEWFQTVPLPATTLATLCALASSILMVEEARKGWVRRRLRLRTATGCVQGSRLTPA